MVGSICTLTGMYPLWYINAMDSIFLALADPSRRTILEMLRAGPATVGALAASLPIARPGVSRHLRVLREAGLVVARHEGQFRVYELWLEPLAQVDDWLAHYRSLWERRMRSLATEVKRGKKERRNAK